MPFAIGHVLAHITRGTVLRAICLGGCAQPRHDKAHYAVTLCPSPTSAVHHMVLVAEKCAPVEAAAIAVMHGQYFVRIL